MDSCEDTRENTPDSDSGYVGSVVTVTSTSRTFPPNSSSNASKSIVPEVSKPSFLSEIQNAQRRRGLETTSMASVTPNGANNVNQPIINAAAMAAAANSSTLGMIIISRKKMKIINYDFFFKRYFFREIENSSIRTRIFNFTKK